MDFRSEVAEWDARLGPAWLHTRGHAERGWLARARGLAAAQAADRNNAACFFLPRSPERSTERDAND